MITTLKLTSILFCLLLTFFSNTTLPVASLPGKNSNNNSAVSVYAVLQTNHFELPQIKSFTSALNGFYRLKEKGIVK